MAYTQEGQNVVYGMMTATTLLAVGALRAHERGVAAMEGARQDAADARYEAAVDEMVRDAEEMGRLAMRLAQELATERQKNEALSRALAQRQGVIDRMRAARS